MLYRSDGAAVPQNEMNCHDVSTENVAAIPLSGRTKQFLKTPAGNS
jgi:hypothetical protein